MSGNRGRLEGRVAVVTGASGGIGSAISRVFANEGAALVLTGRRSSNGEALMSELSASGHSVHWVTADVTQEDGAEAIADRARQTFGKVDVAVLNAAVVYPGHGRFWEVTPDEFDTVFDTNVRGVWLCARALVPLFTDGGSIVVIGSVAGFVTLDNEMVYASTKAALLGLTRGMALDLAPRRIRVNVLCPGFTDTGQTHQVLDHMDDPAALVEKMNQAAPLGRMGTAEEMARAALFLASDDASFCTGISLVADGGMLIR